MKFKIEIPPLEEFIVYEKFYGVLFWDYNILKYYSREDNKVYELETTNEDGTLCILADVEKGEVYSGGGLGTICSLFSEFKSIRTYCIRSVIKHKGEILDGGWYGLMKTLTNETLISEEDMKENCIELIESLFVDEYQNLYALVWNKDDTCIITLPENSGKYSIGEEILHYNVKNIFISQAIAIPGRLEGINGKTYPFSILSCVNSKYLDIDGKKIEGSEVGEHKLIHRISLLSASPNKIELIYSGGNINEIVKAEIENGKVKKKETLVSGLSDNVSALEPVFDKKLHEELIAKGKENGN